MLVTRLARNFSTRSLTDQWFKALQSSSRQQQLTQCIEQISQLDPSTSSHLVKDIIHRFTVDYPTKEALYISASNNETYRKFTFHQVFSQASAIANKLIGHQLNLSTGNNILVLLPLTNEERLFLELACLQSGLIFHGVDQQQSLTEHDIRQRMRTLAIDCIITDQDNLELIQKSTYNFFRPLKKVLIGTNSMNEPLPIGWYHMDKISSKELTSSKRQPSFFMPSSLPHFFTAYWLSMNRLPHLIWLRETNYPISLASWLLGSTIFCKQTDDIQTTMKTLDTVPIDTFCAPKNDYEMLDHQKSLKKHHLEELLCTERVDDAMVKERWYSLTHLNIRDDYAKLPTNESEGSKRMSYNMNHHEKERPLTSYS